MHAYCERCGHEVEGVYRRPTHRKWAKFYFLLPIPFLPVIPMMASDFIICLPGIMVYLLGVGPVLGILRDPPHCGDCGAIARAQPAVSPA